MVNKRSAGRTCVCVCLCVCGNATSHMWSSDAPSVSLAVLKSDLCASYHFFDVQRSWLYFNPGLKAESKLHLFRCLR